MSRDNVLAWDDQDDDDNLSCPICSELDCGANDRDPDTQDWRNIDNRPEFLLWVEKELSSRQAYGEHLFGNLFHGDPLQHAFEELLDALFYLWMARKKMEELELWVSYP
jgi:hypothetical protein